MTWLGMPYLGRHTWDAIIRMPYSGMLEQHEMPQVRLWYAILIWDAILKWHAIISDAIISDAIIRDPILTWDDIIWDAIMWDAAQVRP